MDFKLASVLMMIALVVGVVLGAVAIPTEKIVTREIEVPGQTVIETIEVTKLVDKDYLGETVDLFLEELEDEDDLLTCEDYEYDFDDVELTRVYDEYSVAFDDEDVTVDFTVKFKYKEEDRESCRQTFSVSAFYEEGEDVEFNY